MLPFWGYDAVWMRFGTGKKLLIVNKEAPSPPMPDYLLA